MAVKTLETLEGIRERVLPMLRLVAEEYAHRTPDGYPVVVDAIESGTVGIELDPSYALYFMTDGEETFAELYAQSARTDARSSASRAKFSGLPFSDRRPLEADIPDQTLRNLIAELRSRWNVQPGIIHISDS